MKKIQGSVKREGRERGKGTDNCGFLVRKGYSRMYRKTGREERL